MASEIFKPLVTAAKIELELSKIVVLQESCNTNYDGEVGEGKRVKIVNAIAPTIGTYIPGTDMSEGSTPEGTATYLDIDQYKDFILKFDDVDKAQSMPGVMEAQLTLAARGLAVARDTYIGTLGTLATHKSSSTSANTADETKTAIDTAFVQLWNNGVLLSDEVIIEVTPWFYSIFKDKMTTLLTNNVDLIKNGILGTYNGATVKMSNNLYNDGTDDYLFIRTRQAISFAGGISKTESLRHSKQFADVVRGLDTFGAKIVRPEQLYVLKAHNS